MAIMDQPRLPFVLLVGLLTGNQCLLLLPVDRRDESKIHSQRKGEEMTTEPVTLFTVNQTGLAEIREQVAALSRYEPTDETVRTYASEIEEGLIGSNGKVAGTEIRGIHSRTGKQLPFSISDGGWDAEEI